MKPRDRMIESAIVLLAKQGYRATSFDAVIERAHAPRGSIYHHFPGGKDELIAAAIDLAGERAIAVVDGMRGKSAPDVVDGFMAMWRLVLDKSSFEAGCSVLAITVSAETPQLRAHAGQIFASWREHLAGALEAGGINHAAADTLAATVIAASEGAVAMSRAQDSFKPFDDVAKVLRSMAASLAHQRPTGL
jgi:AcrR family transcriptional regulator